MSDTILDCQWPDCRTGDWVVGYRRNESDVWVAICLAHYDEETVEFRRFTLSEYAAALP